jgi:hypothetical protein
MDQNSKQAVVEYMAGAFKLDVDEIESNLDKLLLEHPDEEASGLIRELSEKVLPKYAHMGRRDAQKALIEQMNTLIKVSNIRRLERRLPLSKTFTMRHLDSAVFMARQRGGYGELLMAAGFSHKKKKR